MFDTHAHLTSEELLPHTAEILLRAKDAGVDEIVNICTDPASLEAGLLLHERAPWVYNAGATTPHDVEKDGEACFELFAKAARTQLLVAVGETGLDYRSEFSTKILQQRLFVRYLHLAAECSLPVVIHCREAFEDLFTIADLEYPKNAQLILHCFTGTMHEAMQALKRGWMISLSGIVTFKKSEQLRLVAKEVPLSYLLVETDAPYLAPQSKRGQMNEPAFLPETLICLAGVKGVSILELSRMTTENARRIFRIPNSNGAR